MTTWAVPKYQWEVEADDYNGTPFKYEVLPSGYDPYQPGSVKVCTTHVHIDIPEGVDLVQAAVKTLEEKIVEKQAKMEYEINELREQINRLQLLEHIA
jgi:hypothetical protein